MTHNAGFLPRKSVDWHRRFVCQARWTADARHFLYQQFGLKECQRVLEVGCGSGVIAADIRLFTPAMICGLDICLDALVFARLQGHSVEYHAGNALALPYDVDTFDVSLCHFLLLWLKDPLSSLREMKRVTRRGGVVAVLAEPDYGGRIDYPHELEALGALQREALRRQGADPTIGRRLGELLQQAGLFQVQVGLLGGHWSARSPQEDFELEWDILYADLQDDLPYEEMEALQHIDREAWQHGRRILFVPTFYAWGIVP